MMPAYGSVDSHPYQKNQMPLPHYYYPGFDISPQMKVDPSKSTLAYEQPWPYVGSYGCPTPIHFCCSGHNFPSYYSRRPAYPHIPIPSPVYYSGGYPPYNEPFSIPYAPPQHYTTELPRYEYDKCVPREYHCCGCPNHPFHQKEGTTVKIEEHEPVTKKKVNEALVPTQMINYPYPFVWIPADYMSSREHNKPVAAEMDDQNKVSNDANHPQYFRADGQEPRSWNGWFPFDTKTLPRMVLYGDGRRNQPWQDDENRRQIEDERTNMNQQSEDKRMELPGPVVWVPYFNKQEEDGKTNDQESTSTPKTIEEVPRTSKLIPVNHSDSGTDRTSSNRDELVNTSGSDVTEKVKNRKSIPVKQMDMHEGEDDTKGSNKKERNIPVKQLEENATDESSKISVKRQSMSPKKGPKLPPVCLRVDPLPKKKNGNGSPRSPSPPASKEHSQAKASETSKVIASSGMNDTQPDSKLGHALNANDEVKQKEENVEVSEKTSENKDDNQRGKSGIQITCNSRLHENSFSATRRKESWPNGDTCITEEKKAERKEEPEVKEEENEPREAWDSTRLAGHVNQKKGKDLSDKEAAILIQAAYRGFQVRKWELLKKLKQIAEVSKQVADVHAQIQASDASSSLQNDDRQRAAIGETIMRLLLKLDTVQALHPSFREIRKNLARELLSMHEKLDSIAAKKSQQQIQELSGMRPVEDIHPGAPSINSVQEEEEEKVTAPRKDSSEGYNRESYDIQESRLDQHSMKDSISSLKTENQRFVAHSLPDDDNIEGWSQISPVSNKEIEPNSALNDTVNEDSGQPATNDVCNLESPLYDNDQAVGENEITSEGRCDPSEVDDLDMRAWKELPQGVIEEEPVQFDSGKEVETHMGRPQQSEIATTMENNSLVMVDELLPDGKFPEIEVMAELPLDESVYERKHSAIKAIVELPVGILDEDITASQCEESQDITSSDLDESEVTKPATQEFLQAVEEGLADDISTETQIEQQLEKQEEVQSREESDGWIKVQCRKDDKQNEEASLDIQVKSGEKVDNGNEQLCATAESQSVASLSGTPMEANDFYHIQPQPVDCRVDPKANTPLNDVAMDKELVEGFTLQDQQIESGNMVDEHAVGANAETSAKETDKVTLPVSEDQLLAEHNKGLDADKQLIGENKKLREMMRKLLEAGNQQLNVISDLTGRVKDLEKKLAKKKRLRTKRYRPATSCMKSLNDLTQVKSARIAI